MHGQAATVHVHALLIIITGQTRVAESGRTGSVKKNIIFYLE